MTASGDTTSVPRATLFASYIGYLRRKLEADGERRLIQTVHGVGYAS